MDGFLKWFYAFMTNMIEGIWRIFSNIFLGFVQIFNFKLYGQQIKSYSAKFTAIDWVLAVVAILVVTAIWAGVVCLIVLSVRKYIRFRQTKVGDEDLLQELADMHQQIIKLSEEKERILGLQISSNVSRNEVEAILAEGHEEPEREKPAETSKSTDLVTDTGAKRFFRLSEVDDMYKHLPASIYNDDFTLEQLCETYRNFACYKMGLYYDIKVIRLMFAGLASTKMILLQGISGTGKTSLPYSLGKFFTHDATIASVQPSWRDRAELFGYFNEFTKKFNETEVLRRIYEASFNDDINLIILDEMNIARVEYYFAEMLSILEMPDPNEWKIDLVPSAWNTDPEHLGDGKLTIPQNVWYIGTANNDDSTFAVSDKVYDRALVINLDDKGVAFDAPPTESANVSYAHVESLYKKAFAEYPVSQLVLDDIGKLDIYVISKFRIAFGNRIMKQLRLFIPVYVACGGTEVDGVDYILATKVFRKFESLNLSLIRDEISGLISYLERMFGKGNMNECIKYLERIQKMY